MTPENSPGVREEDFHEVLSHETEVVLPGVSHLCVLGASVVKRISD